MKYIEKIEGGEYLCPCTMYNHFCYTVIFIHSILTIKQFRFGKNIEYIIDNSHNI